MKKNIMKREPEIAKSVRSYRVSGNNRHIFHGQIEWIKLSRKVLYHFVNFPNS